MTHILRRNHRVTMNDPFITCPTRAYRRRRSPKRCRPFVSKCVARGFSLTRNQPRRVCVGLLLGVPIVAAVLGWGQQKFASAFFQYGVSHTFEGVVRERPYPTLLVARPGATDAASVFSEYLLVGAGKHGANADVAGFNGRRVRLQGSLIYRDGLTMVEVAPHSVETIRAEERGEMRLTPTQPQDLGEFMLVGEIVDSKCYLGVMNPGSRKPHRACAVRCISGGAPPLLIAHDKDGQSASLLLVSPSGEPVNREVLDFIAEPIAITGRVLKDGEQLYLRADPRAIQRVH